MKNRCLSTMNCLISTYSPATSNTRQCGTFVGSSFSGKERDEETGYGYFGARYMDHELMTMWLNVDPMADDDQDVTAYNYCGQSPNNFFLPTHCKYQ